jgi:hypothetical protein
VSVFFVSVPFASPLLAPPASATSAKTHPLFASTRFPGLATAFSQPSGKLPLAILGFAVGYHTVLRAQRLLVVALTSITMSLSAAVMASTQHVADTSGTCGAAIFLTSMYIVVLAFRHYTPSILGSGLLFPAHHPCIPSSIFFPVLVSVTPKAAASLLQTQTHGRLEPRLGRISVTARTWDALNLAACVTANGGGVCLASTPPVPSNARPCWPCIPLCPWADPSDDPLATLCLVAPVAVEGSSLGARRGLVGLHPPSASAVACY